MADVNGQLNQVITDLLLQGLKPGFIAASFSVTPSKVEQLQADIKRTKEDNGQMMPASPSNTEALKLIHEARQQLSIQLELENSVKEREDGEDKVDYISRRLYGKTPAQTLLEIVNQLKMIGDTKSLRSAGDLTLGLMKMQISATGLQHNIEQDKKDEQDGGSANKLDRLFKALEKSRARTQAIDADIVNNE